MSSLILYTTEDGKSQIKLRTKPRGNYREFLGSSKVEGTRK